MPKPFPWSFHTVRSPKPAYSAPCLFHPLESRRLLSAVVDIRLPGGGRAAEISSVGQIINVEVWATIKGSNSNGRDDGLQILTGSILSADRDGGAALGTLTAALERDFRFSPSSTGRRQDLDGDSDADLGSNNGRSVEGFFAVRNTRSPTSNGQVSGDSRSHRIATVAFEVTKLLPGESTRLVFRPRDDNGAGVAALWLEDGVPVTTSNGQFRSGSAVTLTVAPGTPIPDDDTTPPVAKLKAGNVTSAGATGHTFTVEYSDDVAIDFGTVGNGDLLVTGPGEFSRAADFVSADKNADGSVVATYRVAAPGGTWDAADNGTYSVALQNNQVRDAGGNAAAAGKLGSFEADVPKANVLPLKVVRGTLAVKGTNGNDTITVSSAGKNTLRVTVNKDSGTISAKGVKRVFVEALGGNDAVTISAGTIPARVSGGSGDDGLTGGDGRDTLIGEAGDDRLFGGNNNDVLLGTNGDDVIEAQAGHDKLDGGSGADRLSGGSGTDSVDYSTRTAPLRISLDGKPNDGLSNERDNVAADVEIVFGGRANDLIVGSGAANVFHGNAGNDTLRGGSGNDALVGGSGADQLFGEDGNDRLEAKDRTVDVLDGGSGKDAARVDKNDRRSSVEQVLR